MPNRDEPCDALLLRSVDYGESDRILTLLTDRLGKVSCLARGARRSKKRFGGVLQPFSLLRVQLEARRAGMHVLSSAEIAFHPARITTDLERMTSAYGALELLRELSPEDAVDREVMELGVAMMRVLDDPSSAPDALLVSFEARLLTLVGFAPMLDACGYCGKQPPARKSACFDPREGHLVCSECGGASITLTGATRAALVLASEGDLVEGADRLAREAAELHNARRAIRALTEHRLGREISAGVLRS